MLVENTVERILSISKKFTLGVCRCGCNQNIPIRATTKKLSKFVNGHNGRLWIGSKHHNWKGGRMRFRGYVLVKAYGHPRAWINDSWVYEHILVMEKQLGRHLEPHEIIHHKNGIRHDNRIENLQVTTRSEHQKIHKQMRD